MKIPFSPPFIDDDVITEVNHSLNSGWITTGPKVKELEGIVANFSQVPTALGVNSATSGLMLVLHWFGITRGDEVIIPAYTYSATALAVMHIGAKPVMVDSGDDFNIDPQAIANAITEKTKAIIPVDIGGWPCDYEAIMTLVESATVKSKFVPNGAHQENLGRPLILADAAHSIGATYKGKPAVAWADMGVFSLHAVKNVTSAEGGMILANMPAPFDNDAIYANLRLWSLNGQTKDAFSKTQGSSWRYDIVYPGFKMNMPDVLAAIALGQMRKYGTQLIKERARVYNGYKEGFSDCDWAIEPKALSEDRESSYHLYALRIRGINESQRDQIIDGILATGVSVNVHFQPLPLLTVFKERGYNIEDVPNAYEQYSSEISLPIYPQLTEEQVNHVIKTVKEHVERVIK